MMKVLIADDTAFMRVMMRMFLEQLDCVVVGEAKNGKEAVDLYHLLKPDLVTMDITMPDMDGVEAVRHIKSADSDARIIMCSAMGQQRMIMDAIRSGASDFIVKPVQKERLQEAIEKLYPGHKQTRLIGEAYS
ncbi:response regulator [Paenibacillus sp. FJAT-26967]|uniref:response regulator n=1 Tax=Paenibacillus sp. FJAT-26967 TaxID=1729690 RepID=UPI0008398E3F|nr:response regulator [Paenibacillus sp. FJAT-26967]